VVLALRCPAPVRTLIRADTTLAACLALAIAVGGLAQGASVVESLAGAALAVPVAWRSRRPTLVLGVVAAGAVLYLAAVNEVPAYILPMVVALYTAAARGHRRRTLAIAAALGPSVAILVVLFSPDDGSVAEQVLELLSQFGFALVLGEAVRTQRALIDALRERAEHAERERELDAGRRVAEERMRIARELHDVVAHSLATIATQASVGVHLAARDPARAVDALGEVKQVSTNALGELRYAVGTLRDSDGEAPTQPTPSLAALPELVEQARRSGLSVVLRMHGTAAELPAALQLAIYRTVQEALTNVMRHAAGSRATIAIDVDDHRAEVEVTDDGTGAPTALGAPGSGAGLAGMRERAAALGGTFEAGRSAGGGFRVHAVLPVQEQPA
jgi:signal transduction histidine kinase